MSELLLRIEDVSELTGIPVDTLRYWRGRRKGEGPPSGKLGRRVVYRADDVETWIAAGVSPGKTARTVGRRLYGPELPIRAARARRERGGSVMAVDVTTSDYDDRGSHVVVGHEDGARIDVSDGHLFVLDGTAHAVAIYAPSKWVCAELTKKS